MAVTPYELDIDLEKSSFEFVSEGPKGKITKRVLFQLIRAGSGLIVYNLAFGDRQQGTGELNDQVVSNNGDTDKVLATVVAAIILFLYYKRQENVLVYAVGSTKARTRLYQMGINKYYDNDVSDLKVLGQTHDENWEPFKKGISYQAFLVSRKSYI